MAVSLTKIGKGEGSLGLEAKEFCFKQVKTETLIRTPRKVNQSGRYSDLEFREKTAEVTDKLDKSCFGRVVESEA